MKSWQIWFYFIFACTCLIYKLIAFILIHSLDCISCIYLLPRYIYILYSRIRLASWIFGNIYRKWNLLRRRTWRQAEENENEDDETSHTKKWLMLFLGTKNFVHVWVLILCDEIINWIKPWIEEKKSIYISVNRI